MGNGGTGNNVIGIWILVARYMMSPGVNEEYSSLVMTDPNSNGLTDRETACFKTYWNWLQVKGALGLPLRHGALTFATELIPQFFFPSLILNP
jgi:hypothetical protein